MTLLQTTENLLLSEMLATLNLLCKQQLVVTVFLEEKYLFSFFEARSNCLFLKISSTNVFSNVYARFSLEAAFLIFLIYLPLFVNILHISKEWCCVNIHNAII